MPTYEYACKSCGRSFEVVQGMKDAALTTCDQCGGELRKVFFPAGIMFKGSGFYATDNRKGTKGTSKAGEPSASGSGGTGDGGGGTGDGGGGTGDGGGGTGDGGGGTKEKTSTGSSSGSESSGSSKSEGKSEGKSESKGNSDAKPAKTGSGSSSKKESTS